MILPGETEAALRGPNSDHVDQLLVAVLDVYPAVAEVQKHRNLFADRSGHAERIVVDGHLVTGLQKLIRPSQQSIRALLLQAISIATALSTS